MTDAKIVPIRRALISVSDKTGLLEIAQSLVAAKIEILSTGGTAKTLREMKIEVKDVSSETGFPEIMDGRVKTLHPKIHGAILARRDNTQHLKAMQQHDIMGIDLLVVNLYPFAKTLQSGAAREEIVDNIDVGGPAMIRAAAKNHDFVCVLTDPADYEEVIATIQTQGGLSLMQRRKFAQKAFSHTSYYDALIANWFAAESQNILPDVMVWGAVKKQTLRYGENAHQKGALYERPFAASGITQAMQLQGKELSYNNLNDADAALELVREFGEPAVAIIKHANPCGVAQATNLAEAYARAFACDKVSAFGGVIAVNRKLDQKSAEAITQIFTEVVIAPDADHDARGVFAKKPNLRLLTLPDFFKFFNGGLHIKSIGGGYLLQEEDRKRISPSDLKVVTDKKPSECEVNDMLFAFTVAKHVKSNAIVYAKDSATLGIGAGQMSRVDSTRIAKIKAQEMALDLKHSVAASDAFFPFADGLETLAEAGVSAVIQPGGSVRDDEVIKAANKAGIAMVFTGIRHFRH